MTVLSTNIFAGLLPRVSPSLLPDTHATVAQNCDFAYGELRGLKSDFQVQSLVNAASSIYTDDGVAFYSWIEDVDAVRSPLSNDTFNRLYYTTPTDFRVTTRSGMGLGGGPPGSSYRVGVPQPSSAPVITAPDTALPADAQVTAIFHYEYSGLKYQEFTVPLNTVTPGKRWTFSAPTKDVTTPTQAQGVLLLTAKDTTSGSQIFSVYSLNSAFATESIWRLTLSGGAAPAPNQPAIFTADLAVSVSEAELTTTAYVYTYVNTYGEEGPPSAPASISIPTELYPSVQVKKDAISDYAPIKEIRVYKTVPGQSVVDYFFAYSIPVLSSSSTVFTTVDKVNADAINEPLTSDENYPPSPALVGLMILPNGIACARKGNELHFSKPYQMWAWPPGYVKTYKHNLVGGMVHGSGALITTTVQGFFISGISPDAMTETSIGLEQGGVSKWSLAKVGELLVYACNDGIVVVEGGIATMKPSERYFTRDVWRGLYKNGFSTMRFAVWDGRLIAYSTTGSFTPFMLRFDEAAGSMTDLPNFTANCSFTSPLSDQCYLVRGNVLYQFAGGSEVTATWASREIKTAAPVNLGVAQVICEGSWTVRFYAKKPGVGFVLKHTKTVTQDTVLRLPSGFKADRWKIGVSGTGRMRELHVARVPEELRRT